MPEADEGVEGAELPLQSWIKQMRFEVQTSSSIGMMILYVGVLVMLFNQIIVTMIVAGLPQSLYVPISAVVLFGLGVATVGVRLSQKPSAKQWRLLRQVYLKKLDVKAIRQKYEEAFAK